MESLVLQDPNFIYLLLLLGLWAAVLGIYTPGTGVIETAAFLALAGAFVLMALNPATSWFAVIALVAGVMWYLLTPLFRHDLARLGLIGLALQVIGGLALFAVRPVSPVFIAITAGLSFAFYQFVLVRFLKHQASQPPLDEEVTPGATGWVVKTLDPVGTVNVQGELWTAYSDDVLQPGERIAVIEKEGLRLHVEKAKPKRHPAAELAETHLGRDLSNDGELPRPWEADNLTEQSHKETP
ncbi:MAG: hypothetical protein IT323_03085 [Anaerolineae bacterium]|nr:hypothetical protein [Anaerolineae bacterium]